MRVRSRRGKTHSLQFDGDRLVIGPKPVTLTAQQGEYVMNLIGGELKVINYGSTRAVKEKEHPHNENTSPKR